MDKFNQILPNIAKQYGIMAGMGGTDPAPATPPQAVPAVTNPAAAAATEANDSKLKALKTGQAEQKSSKANPTPAKEEEGFDLKEQARSAALRAMSPFGPLLDKARQAISK